MRRRRCDLQIGVRVKVCVDERTELLNDMGILGPDKKTLKNVWMYGTVKSQTANHWNVQLPAAEECLPLLKGTVALVSNDYRCPSLYVLFGDHIKTVTGLQFADGFLPADYFDSMEDAKTALQNACPTKPTSARLSTPTPATCVSNTQQVFEILLLTTY